MGVSPVSTLYTNACITLRGQKSVMDALRLEIQMVVGHHVGAGKETQVLHKSS